VKRPFASKVVRIENEPTNVEHPIKNEVAFETPDASVYRVFLANVEFVVEKCEKMTLKMDIL
jgi:hypothetical protein